MTTYYEILGVQPDADERTIKRAYRQKSLELHPDRNLEDPEGATAKFKEINEAFATLTDSDKKKQYNIVHAGEILPPGKKKEIMQLLSRLDNEVESFIKNLYSPNVPESEKIIPEERVSLATRQLLQDYQAEIHYAMQQVYNQNAPEKLHEPLQRLMVKAKETANNPLIANEPAITGFFTKIINAIKNCLIILFPNHKIEVGGENRRENKKILGQFDSIKNAVSRKQSEAELAPKPDATHHNPKA